MFFRRIEKKNICVALSGGVDSAFVAYLLKKQGHAVTGAFIKGYNVDGCQDESARDAARVAAHLGIPFYTFDFEREYKERVVAYLLDGYKKGITPNPDVVCNSQIKFGLLYDEVMKLGFDGVASGHYAILKRGRLYEAKDKTKDQSYFLWEIPKERFSNILFPIGGLLKSKVRSIARKAKLPNADKKDSQGICFLGKFNFNDFLIKHLGKKEGDVFDVSGRVVGKHYGAHLYTIGQRHGFLHTTNKPLYIISKDISKNTLTAVHLESDELKTDRFITSSARFFDERFYHKLVNGEAISVLARCRYHQPLFRCVVSMHGKYLSVVLPKRSAIFPASGQSCVMYANKRMVLGGSIIVGYET